MLSQILEISLFNALNSCAIYSLALLAIQIHGSHLLIGLIVFSLITVKNLVTGNFDLIFEFGICYWHLIELV